MIIYGTSWCPHCAKARRFFEKHQLKYLEYDIEKSTWARQEFQQLGGQGIPLVKIGDQLIQGYDASAMRDALMQFAEEKPQ